MRWGYKRWGVCPFCWGLRGRGNSLLFPQLPPPVQVLEVLTAAVEYGLEELREVGVSGRLSCFPRLSA